MLFQDGGQATDHLSSRLLFQAAGILKTGKSTIEAALVAGGMAVSLVAESSGAGGFVSCYFKFVPF